MTPQEARALFQAHKATHERRGAIFPRATMYIPPEWKEDDQVAMDAQPALFTDPNTGIPAFLTTMIDPQVYKILFAPNKAAAVLGEVRKGTWVDQTAMFPVVEHDGEVSSYGDFSENGHAGANTGWPQRQSYLFQIILEYGELETERAGLGRVNWLAELQAATATVHNKFQNLTYLFGVNGLQNYGLLNDPNLSAPLTPAVKAYGGTAWISSGQIKATANEIYADIQAMFIQLVSQATGLIEEDQPLVLALSPQSAVALTATNSFNVNVYELLKGNFPNIRFEKVPQYGVQTTANSQGVVGGNLVQLLAENVEGQATGYCSFNEKMRAHKLIPALSSYRQKMTGGSWGAILRQPFAIAQMLGV